MHRRTHDSLLISTIALAVIAGKMLSAGFHAPSIQNELEADAVSAAAPQEEIKAEPPAEHVAGESGAERNAPPRNAQSVQSAEPCAAGSRQHTRDLPLEPPSAR